jgi:MerR family transcriptional regulator, copper efflux regulator
MNIKEVSRRSGLPPKTIRYYEEIGLVKPARESNDYRVFSEADVHNLTFLARSRALGFSIEDCRALLALWRDKGRASAAVRQIATEHLTGIEAKIADLIAMRDTLSDLVSHCHGDTRPDCPILSSLGGAARQEAAPRP